MKFPPNYKRNLLIFDYFSFYSILFFKYQILDFYFCDNIGYFSSTLDMQNYIEHKKLIMSNSVPNNFVDLKKKGAENMAKASFGYSYFTPFNIHFKFQNPDIYIYTLKSYFFFC